MPSLGNQNQGTRGIDWPAIARTLLMQVLVLLALSGAVIGYLNWSSDVAWEEFIEASKSPVPGPTHHAQSPTAGQAAKDQTACYRKQ